MKLPNNLYSRLSLITSVTLITGYVLVYAAGYITIPSVDYTTGKPLTSTLFGNVVSNIEDLNTRLSNLSFSGTNVGIGVSPTQKLSVAGTIESTSGGFKFPDGTIQTTSAPGDWIRVTAWTSTYGGSSALCQAEFWSQWRVCGYPEIAGYTKDISQKGIGGISWVACGRSNMLQSGITKKIGISGDAVDSSIWTCPAANGCDWEQLANNGAYLHCTRTESTPLKIYCCRN